jgi:hypothetical protein
VPPTASLRPLLAYRLVGRAIQAVQGVVGGQVSGRVSLDQTHEDQTGFLQTYDGRGVECPVEKVEERVGEVWTARMMEGGPIQGTVAPRERLSLTSSHACAGSRVSDGLTRGVATETNLTPRLLLPRTDLLAAHVLEGSACRPMSVH